MSGDAAPASACFLLRLRVEHLCQCKNFIVIPANTEHDHIVIVTAAIVAIL